MTIVQVGGLLPQMVHMRGATASLRSEVTLEIIVLQVNSGLVFPAKSIMAEVPSRFHSKY
ncbi:hypothetical protein SLEP1_g52262 [Rubroshorea leprosula]|uniref:Uncharacterized protein n=1 Tax=Rubroshorea leprosula TaxID=152421 RepID=A0AAV5M6S1_9ROSI|nr:hypothetical protein SLEP1_g52262 [Rubroshorea leprosula]